MKESKIQGVTYHHHISGKRSTKCEFFILLYINLILIKNVEINNMEVTCLQNLYNQNVEKTQVHKMDLLLSKNAKNI